MLPPEIGLSSKKKKIVVQSPQDSWAPKFLPPTPLQVSQPPQDIRGWMRGADTDLPLCDHLLIGHGGSLAAPGHDL